MLDLRKNDFMDVEQMKNEAPSIFTTTPSGNVTEKYVYIPTLTVIQDMELLGWGVVDVKEVKARTNGTRGFQKHLVVFRNNDLVIEGENGDDVSPQILLTNSYDGKSCFEFVAGLFRMICENGLVVTTEEFENVRIRHMGYTFEELQKQVFEMVERLPLTVESMNRMKETELRDTQIVDFARKAVRVRFGEGTQKVDIAELVEPERAEDIGKDLWSVFNVVQEKLANGNFEYRYNNKTRKGREIKNFKQDQQFNKDLFKLALSYAA